MTLLEAGQEPTDASEMADGGGSGDAKQGGREVETGSY